MSTYVLIAKTPVREPDAARWADWFESADRYVRRTRVGPYLTVSTVFLGVDHGHFSGPPLLFETMVFVHDPHAIPCGGHRLDRDFQEIQMRCSTWPEAEAQHQKIIDEIKRSGDDIEEILNNA